MRVIEIEHRGGGPEALALARAPGSADPGPARSSPASPRQACELMDIYQREGVGGYARPVPFVTGGEGAGTVTAVGEGVTGLAAHGDLVAWLAPGSYAEQVALPTKPGDPGPGRDHRGGRRGGDLAGHDRALPGRQYLPGAGSGDVTVVHAAAGGVGLLLTQMVKHRGGVVLATCYGGGKGGNTSWRARRARTASPATTGSAPWWARSPTARARTWSTTASARPPSMTAWPRCGPVACWSSTEPPAARCRRSTSSGSTAAGHWA